MSANVVYHLLTREWFGALIKPAPDRVLSLLLVNVYICAEQGLPLSKKDAWKSIGIEDARTGRKYISRAEQLGLLETKRSEQDRRRELLLPSESLQDAMHHELELLEGDLIRYTTTLQDLPRTARRAKLNLDSPRENFELITLMDAPCPVCGASLQCVGSSPETPSSPASQTWQCKVCGYGFEAIAKTREESESGSHENVKLKVVARWGPKTKSQV